MISCLHLNHHSGNIDINGGLRAAFFISANGSFWYKKVGHLLSYLELSIRTGKSNCFPDPAMPHSSYMDYTMCMSTQHAWLMTGLFAGVLISTTVRAAECEPMPSMFEGTHHKPITQQQVNIGQGLVVHGRVLAAPDCRPVPGARIAHWQAGEKGRYVDHLRAWLVSGADGSYRFETEWPALPVPHIHFTVTAEGYRPLTTQWVGDAPVDRIEFDIILPPE